MNNPDNNFLQVVPIEMELGPFGLGLNATQATNEILIFYYHAGCTSCTFINLKSLEGGGFKMFKTPCIACIFNKLWICLVKKTKLYTQLRPNSTTNTFFQCKVSS